MRGFLNINKPGGKTSRDIVNVVNRVLRIRSAGHAGTLDPLATGVLVVAVGAATRLVSSVQEQPKEYVAGFLLGRRSDTDDITGTVVEARATKPPDQEDINRHLERFIGRILQVPPSYSAVHVNGERAYDKARRAESFELPPRPVEIHAIEILNYCFPKLELKITCGSGTYIRAIGRDLGELLGCGAVMSSLVRARVGAFSIESAIPLEALTPERAKSSLLPLRDSVRHLPVWTCSAADALDFRHGRAVNCTRFPADQPVAAVDSTGELIAVTWYDATRGQLRPRLVFPAPE